MKKIILSFALLGAFGLATLSAQAQQATQVEKTDKSAQDKIILPQPPHFASDDVNEGVADLVKLFQEYAPAIRAKDTVKLIEFATKMQTLQQGASAWVMQMSPEEQQELKSYMIKVGTTINPKINQAGSPSNEPSKIK